MTQPPLVLAIETSGDMCGVAVARGDALLCELTFSHRMRLSERLMGHLDVVLGQSECRLADLDAFAVGLGPGSFTGARIGVMTAKVFAELHQVPLFGVDALEAMAVGAHLPAGTIVAPMAPCRTGVVYTAAYRTAPQGAVRLTYPAALPISDVASLTALGAQVVAVGPAVARYREALEAAGLLIGHEEWPRAATVGQIACGRMRAGIAPDDIRSLAPYYISPPPITLPRDRRGLTPGPPTEGE